MLIDIAIPFQAVDVDSEVQKIDEWAGYIPAHSVSTLINDYADYYGLQVRPGSHQPLLARAEIVSLRVQLKLPSAS